MFGGGSEGGCVAARVGAVQKLKFRYELESSTTCGTFDPRGSSLLGVIGCTLALKATFLVLGDRDVIDQIFGASLVQGKSVTRYCLRRETMFPYRASFHRPDL
jgi:hypothetical protein